MKTIALLTLMLLSLSCFGETVCTPKAKIKTLWPRSAGWVHIQLEGVDNMDIKNCGAGGVAGLLFNFNDSSGTNEGKKMMYATLLASFMSGKELSICSYDCDSQHPSFSSLDEINYLQ